MAALALVPALGYVVSYLALQHAIDAGLARTRTTMRFGASVQSVGGTPAYAAVTLADGDGGRELQFALEKEVPIGKNSELSIGGGAGVARHCSILAGP